MAARLTVHLVGDSMFRDTVAMQMTDVSQLAVTLASDMENETADTFYLRLLEAARYHGGRLLVVDRDGKVTADSYDESVGARLALSEMTTVLSGKTDGDYGFHLLTQDTQQPSALRRAADLLLGRQSGGNWVGCYAAPMERGGERAGALLMIVSVQDTVNSLDEIQIKMLGIFLLALLIVLLTAGFITRVITRPVAALSAGIEHMGKGDYQHRVHVKGKGEMAQLAEAFNHMSEQIRTLDEARNQFVSNASHELKTPLATIKILVESMMYEENMPKELRAEFLSDINKEIDRLSSVVGDLLTLVHIDSNKLRLRREMIVFADTVRESAGRLAPLAKKREQTLDIQISDSCEMFADPGKLGQVCYNIIENAIKYTPDGGKITVKLKKSGRDAVLEITDTGVGIPPEDQPHVFDRFYRVDKARSRDTGGTGLGLSIVQQIIRLHAGSIQVFSEVGKGTTFVIQLPVK
ncbi:MAG: HAMP domain-containing histidine kinase [Clostridia bacterium]|nr:HAMP domain-containing histidine kinase [Clostridia bacterium]